jgi:hypothetical protein
LRTTRLGLGFCLLLLAACATLPPQPQDPGLFLLKPQDAGQNLDLSQNLSFQRGKFSFEGLAQLEIRPDHVALAGLSPLGNRVMSFRWDGKDFVEERDPSLPPQFPLKLILRDLQLAYWPAISVEAALPAGWSLAEKPSEREILHGADPEIRIHYSDTEHWHHGLLFENLALGYRIQIDVAGDTGAAAAGEP